MCIQGYVCVLCRGGRSPARLHVDASQRRQLREGLGDLVLLHRLRLQADVHEAVLLQAGGEARYSQEHRGGAGGQAALALLPYPTGTGEPGSPRAPPPSPGEQKAPPRGSRAHAASRKGGETRRV